MPGNRRENVNEPRTPRCTPGCLGPLDRGTTEPLVRARAEREGSPAWLYPPAVSSTDEFYPCVQMVPAQSMVHCFEQTLYLLGRELLQVNQELSSVARINRACQTALVSFPAVRVQNN